MVISLHSLFPVLSDGSLKWAVYVVELFKEDDGTSYIVPLHLLSNTLESSSYLIDPMNTLVLKDVTTILLILLYVSTDTVGHFSLTVLSPSFLLS